MDLNDKEFYDWAVKKLARDTKIEEVEEFCAKYPPTELTHMFKVLEQKVIPMLVSEGIPMTKDECLKLFRYWFVKKALPTSPEQPDDNNHDPNRTRSRYRIYKFALTKRKRLINNELALAKNY